MAGVYMYGVPYQEFNYLSNNTFSYLFKPSEYVPLCNIPKLLIQDNYKIKGINKDYFKSSYTETNSLVNGYEGKLSYIDIICGYNGVYRLSTGYVENIPKIVAFFGGIFDSSLNNLLFLKTVHEDYVNYFKVCEQLRCNPHPSIFKFFISNELVTNPIYERLYMRLKKAIYLHKMPERVVFKDSLNYMLLKFSMDTSLPPKVMQSKLDNLLKESFKSHFTSYKFTPKEIKLVY